MSSNESTESSDTVYQTPTAIIIERPATHEELEPEVETEGVGGPGDIGASPELVGPVTRSGRKRKNPAPVKSTGKKKNKTMTSRTPPKNDAPHIPAAQGAGPSHSVGSSTPTAPTTQTSSDLAQLLTAGLSNIQQSMAGMENRLSGMEDRLAEKIDNLETKVNKNKDSIVILTDSVNKNTIDLARFESQLRGCEEGLESKVTNIVKSVISRGDHTVSTIPTPQTGGGLSGDQIDRYLRCRRSLRLWPIRGPDLAAEVRRFLMTSLGFSTDQVDQDFGPVEVRRVIEPRSKIEAEVVVEFRSAPVRDAVKSRGFKLEGQRAGIRIEVPNYLKSDFHVLQNLSYRLKLANRDMKRSVKFEDDCYGIMLDIQLPGQDWRRVRPAQARAARRADPSLQSGPLELSVDMIAGAVRGPDLPALTDSNWTSAPSFNASGSDQSAASLARRPRVPLSGSQTHPSGDRQDGTDEGERPTSPGAGPSPAASGVNALPLGRRS